MKKAQGKKLIDSMVRVIKSTAGYELNHFTVDRESDTEVMIRDTHDNDVFYAIDIVALLFNSPCNGYLTVEYGKPVLRIYVITSNKR